MKVQNVLVVIGMAGVALGIAIPLLYPSSFVSSISRFTSYAGSDKVRAHQPDTPLHHSI